MSGRRRRWDSHQTRLDRVTVLSSVIMQRAVLDVHPRVCCDRPPRSRPAFLAAHRLAGVVRGNGDNRCLLLPFPHPASPTSSIWFVFLNSNTSTLRRVASYDTLFLDWVLEQHSSPSLLPWPVSSAPSSRPLLHSSNRRSARWRKRRLPRESTFVGHSEHCLTQI